jgi:hypothetical protein
MEGLKMVMHQPFHFILLLGPRGANAHFSPKVREVMLGFPVTAQSLSVTKPWVWMENLVGLPAPAWKLLSPCCSGLQSRDLWWSPLTLDQTHQGPSDRLEQRL